VGVDPQKSRREDEFIASTVAVLASAHRQMMSGQVNRLDLGVEGLARGSRRTAKISMCRPPRSPPHGR
jgi:hypothetical protein